MAVAARDQYDVAIIGGGPAGSTAGTLLRKYDPSIRVVILEKERFPREKIGESQLPAIGPVLHEMGAWDKIEAANFPIKVGVTYRWGHSPKLWDFEFIPYHRMQLGDRPGKFEGQRRLTAFQVERARYDDILLRHAAEQGCEVREETQVREVQHEGDRITGLRLDDGSVVTARHYLDCSGHIGIVRRALGIGATVPTALMNIAIWDYWENTEWAVEIGVGGTRSQIMSLPGGWIWFIPLGPTRTSVGFVCPQEYYKKRGISPEQLYDEALKREPRISALCAKGSREGRIRTTKDWSFVADRIAGDNWFLVGEAAGFADPILSGGMTLAHTSAREAAYNILAIDRAEHDEAWLREQYNERQRRRVMQYIRFADYWYCANGQFTDLEEMTAQIAKDADLDMSPRQAFRWLSFGGFAHEDFSYPGLGGLDLLAVKEVTKLFVGESADEWEINKYNTFNLDLTGAKKHEMPVYSQGKILKAECFVRAGRWLPNVGLYGVVIKALRKHHDLRSIGVAIEEVAKAQAARGGMGAGAFTTQAISTLETMLVEGWVKGSNDPKKRGMNYKPMLESNFHDNTDVIPGLPASPPGQRPQPSA
jgi:flavin-dependent dehydrogenase